MLGSKIQLIWSMNFKKYGVDHEYIIKGDEGHGYLKRHARLELLKRYEKFLAKYLD